MLNNDLFHWSNFRTSLTNRLTRWASRANIVSNLHRPIVTFTFDDAPDSSIINGGNLLEAFDSRATFYISAKFLTLDGPHWRYLSHDQLRHICKVGHEIGCHTLTHIPISKMKSNGLSKEIDDNLIQLRKIIPDLTIENFAFPYGESAVWHRKVLMDRFHSCRGIVPHLNVGNINTYLLGSFPLIDHLLPLEKLNAIFDDARQRNAWLIFYTHDVCNAPSPYGCTPDLLLEALKLAKTLNFEIITIEKALEKLSENTILNVQPSIT